MRNWKKIYISYKLHIIYYNLLYNCCFCDYFKQDDGGLSKGSELMILQIYELEYMLEQILNVWNITYLSLYGLEMQITVLGRN